jgi:hypothetical protein
VLSHQGKPRQIILCGALAFGLNFSIILFNGSQVQTETNQETDMSKQPEKIAPQTRQEEIEGMLNAYRQGWISYDKAHVIELQTERAAILKVQKETPSK